MPVRSGAEWAMMLKERENAQLRAGVPSLSLSTGIAAATSNWHDIALAANEAKRKTIADMVKTPKGGGEASASERLSLWREFAAGVNLIAKNRDDADTIFTFSAQKIRDTDAFSSTEFIETFRLGEWTDIGTDSLAKANWIDCRLVIILVTLVAHRWLSIDDIESCTRDGINIASLKIAADDFKLSVVDKRVTSLSKIEYLLDENSVVANLTSDGIKKITFALNMALNNAQEFGQGIGVKVEKAPPVVAIEEVSDDFGTW